ncbi:winged helix DNA-binding domain-containing protein [Hymenobacter negativus]|uniref:AlkZ family DNA glycosylase n=1 Tax=Hymenobacter negativus TaxID=2795026 RepID=A0ABS0Q403_9BACT|nr:winged helix DNA-binding domain-containing protein [Hymenobacter negativus]MBH8557019.1 AlkZ family DNA glycosylase [Hymenobacter negativus]
MTHPEIARLRLLNQRISGEKCPDPAAVVRWMGALQAQDYGQAVWAVGLRTLRPALAAVEQALADGQLVLTWPMRGTMHLVPAEDAAWMVRLLAPRVLRGLTARLRQLELDQTTIERSKTVFYEALCGGRRLTRAGMMQALEQAGISTQGQRGYHLLGHTAQLGHICFGPQLERQQTFVLLDEWVPNARKLDREEALAELTRRYFRSHGPATVHDFANWAGLTLADARQGLEAVQPGLVSAKVEEQLYWFSAEEMPVVAPTNAVQLLPGFDEYLLGYKDRRAVLAQEHAAKVVPGGNGVFKPMVVVDGQIVGTWQRAVKKGVVDVVASFFDKALEADAVACASRQYADFLGLPLGGFRVESKC